jgi:hypothetical protein
MGSSAKTGDPVARKDDRGIRRSIRRSCAQPWNFLLNTGSPERVSRRSPSKRVSRKRASTGAGRAGRRCWLGARLPEVARSLPRDLLLTTTARVCAGLGAHANCRVAGNKRRPRNARRHADRSVDAPPADVLSRRELSQRIPRLYDQTSSPSRLRCLRSQTTDDVAGGHTLEPPPWADVDNSSARRGNTWTCGTPLPAPRKP